MEYCDFHTHLDWYEDSLELENQLSGFKGTIIAASVDEKSFKKIVVTKDIVQPHYDEYGILTVNIYDFLLDPQILEK